MTAQMERILMAFRLVLIFKAVATIRTFILFFLFMYTKLSISIFVFIMYSGWGKLLQFFLRIKFFGLFWTAFANVNPLHFGCFVFCSIVGPFSSHQGSGI
jgi:hypothetical protein